MGGDRDTMSDKTDLKFARTPRITALLAYLDKARAATIRIDDEKEIKEGEKINITDKNGVKYGEADVEEVCVTKVDDALDVASMRGARHSTVETDNLIAILNRYYSRTVTGTTECKVIIYKPTMIVPIDENVEDLDKWD